jgi:hypothetical protein
MGLARFTGARARQCVDGGLSAAKSANGQGAADRVSGLVLARLSYPTGFAGVFKTLTAASVRVPLTGDTDTHTHPRKGGGVRVCLKVCRIGL